MSGTGEDVDKISDYITTVETLSLLPPTSYSSTKSSNHRIVILYVVGVFLAIVLIIAMGYLLKLNYKSWLPKRKHLCDFRDCFRQSNGKKRKFFSRNSHKSNFTIPVVVVSDENGQCLDPECVDLEEAETKFAQTFP
ncbi:unnamed protein product [Orchesella dallaii]|uniref:Uncharacterized protein n=1 Tax=Orchesella dallaii TaxID=48710 RepID=A0ABP1QTQ2_9HEXA